jgi:hypothetical protein
VPQQGGDGLGQVEPVGAQPEPGGAVGTGGIGCTQCGDLAGLLAVERDQAAGEAVAGDDVPPGGGPGGEPLVQIVLGTFTELPSTAGQPGQESGRYGEALLGPLVGAVAKRRSRGASTP